jgi:ribose transport system permease protein
MEKQSGDNVNDHDKKITWGARLKSLFGRQEFGVFIPLTIMIIVTYVFNNNFLSPLNIRGIVIGATTNAYLALGMSLVMICGDIDISVGTLAGLGMMTCFTLYLRAGLPFFLSFLAAIGVGVLCGLVKGLLCTKAMLFPFIVTIGANFICRGLKYYITGGYQLYPFPPALMRFSNSKVLGVSWSFIIIIILFIIFGFIMSHTSFGRKMYASGDNRNVAKLSGINVDWMRTAAFIIASVLSVIGGIMLAIMNKVADPMVGDGMEMNAIAAVAVGGIAFDGGRGSLAGTAIGIVLISVINNALVSCSG